MSETASRESGEKALNPKFTEFIKNAHVIGYTMEAYQLALQEGFLEGGTEAVKERIKEYLTDNINEYSSIKSIADLGSVFDLSPDDFDENFIEEATTLLGRALDKSLHVYGLPDRVESFLRFMGKGPFANNPYVREVVLKAMEKYASNSHVVTVPSAMNALIDSFGFKRTELNKILTPELEMAMREAPDATFIAATALYAGDDA